MSQDWVRISKNDMNVGLIGKGYWGSILKSKLEQICNLNFICGSSDEYISKLHQVDWVFIATPNDTHYDIVKGCIESGVNVFCEKPLTPSYSQSKHLFELADEFKVKLYVDDVFNYRDEIIDLNNIINTKDKIQVSWNSKNKKNNFDLLYHDLYLLYPILKNKQNINWPNINNVNFNYEVSNNEHIINGINFTHKQSSNDALLKMVEEVINSKANYKHNKLITLFCNKIIDDISNNPNIQITRSP